VLMGDANTTFFHACANGRRRKTKIISLDTENGNITKIEEIKKHIVDFYKQLFGSSAHSRARLSPNFWSREEQLEADDRSALQSPFGEKEVITTIQGMKADSAPGPMVSQSPSLRNCGSTLGRSL
jgi:hypothetical protein